MTRVSDSAGVVVVVEVPQCPRPTAVAPRANPSDVGLVGLDVALKKRSREGRKTRSKL